MVHLSRRAALLTALFTACAPAMPTSPRDASTASDTAPIEDTAALEDTAEPDTFEPPDATPSAPRFVALNATRIPTDFVDAWGNASEVWFLGRSGTVSYVVRYDGTTLASSTLALRLNCIGGSADGSLWALGDSGTYGYFDRTRNSWIRGEQFTTGTVRATWGDDTQRWAVGEFIGSSNLRRTTPARITEWELGDTFDPPSPIGQGELYTVAGQGGSVWIVGENGGARWDGTRWHRVASSGHADVWAINAARAISTNGIRVEFFEDDAVIIPDAQPPGVAAPRSVLRAVWSDGTTHVVVGTNGYAAMARRGRPWQRIETPVTSELRFLWGTSPDRLFAGTNGTILQLQP